MFKEELQFIKKPITSRVKSFDDACRVMGITEVASNILEIYYRLPNPEQTYSVALYKLKIIVEALNEGWKPNWADSNEEKHYPVYIKKDNKLAFNDSTCTDSGSHGGLYLCFKTEELSDYFGSVAEVTEIYNDFQK